MARSASGAHSVAQTAPPPPPPPKVTPKAPSASIALSGDTYTDSATESHKNIQYNVTWSGGAKEDYLIVQQLKGYLKDEKGHPYKVKMYDKLTDFNFADWQIDSVDADPAYWSDASGRWNYHVDAADKFSATDDPGPPSWVDGASAQVDFKVGAYKAADVPKTTTGSIPTTPLTDLKPWSYHVQFTGGKFKH